MLLHLALETIGEPPCLEIGPARIRRDREAPWDGDPELGHLGETHALAAEEDATGTHGLVEVEDIAIRHRGMGSLSPADRMPSGTGGVHLRCSTSPMMRCEISSIESSLTSRIGQPSRRCTCAAYSSSA